MCRVLAINFFAGFLMTAALQSTSNAAVKDWPKEYQDLVSGACVIDLLEGSDPSDEIRMAITSTCECQTDEMQRILSVQDLKDLMTMPSKMRNSTAKGKVLNLAAEGCRAKYKLDAILDAARNGPVSQKGREILLMECVYRATKDRPNLAEGGKKLSNACLCGVDKMLSKYPSWAAIWDSESEIQLMMNECLEIHAPSQ